MRNKEGTGRKMNVGLIIMLIVAVAMIVIAGAAAVAITIAGTIVKEFEEWRG
nr:MAG TPA: hypothetical protein [Caudoviricetes sp.]